MDIRTDIRQAVSVAMLAGLFAAGAAMTSADAVPAQIEVDGVVVTALVSADYMPPIEP